MKWLDNWRYKRLAENRAIQASKDVQKARDELESFSANSDETHKKTMELIRDIPNWVQK